MLLLGLGTSLRRSVCLSTFFGEHEVAAWRVQKWHLRSTCCVGSSSWWWRVLPPTRPGLCCVFSRVETFSCEVVYQVEVNLRSFVSVLAVAGCSKPTRRGGLRFVLRPAAS